MKIHKQYNTYIFNIYNVCVYLYIYNVCMFIGRNRQTKKNT